MSANSRFDRRGDEVVLHQKNERFSGDLPKARRDRR
jgi:hypothetical protein